jgi:hypothetical protein
MAKCAFTAGGPEETRAKFGEMLKRVRFGPLGSGRAYADLVGTVAARLYAPRLWSGLAEMLQDVWTGNSMGPEPASSDVVVTDPVAGTSRAVDSADGEQYGSLGQFLGVVCGESPNPGPKAFPEIDDFAFSRSGAVGGGWTWLAEPCATWPIRAAARYTGPWDARTKNPILVIGITHDPATPYQGAVAMSEQLGRARLLTMDGYGHGAFGQFCTYPYVNRYFTQGIVPPRGTRCRGFQPFG